MPSISNPMIIENSVFRNPNRLSNNFFLPLVVFFFRQEENQKIIRRLKEAGVRLEEAVARPSELPLTGQEVVITGRLEAFSRQDAETRIKELGGTAKDNVTRKTNFVVVGADPGSKLARAQELDVKTLNEEEFIKLLKQT